MIASPKISAVMRKKYPGKTVISWNGKILGVGENAVIALKKAKKVMSNIEEKEFLVSRIYAKYIAV